MTGQERAAQECIDHEPLLRAYQRLLRAYPRWYRRERGVELLTTLVDAAEPGQRRPSGADIADLLRGAWRVRSRMPRRPGPWVVGVIVVFYAVLLGGAGAVLLTPYPGPPSETEAAAIAATALPWQPHNVPGPPVHCYMVCPEWDGRDDVMAFDGPPDQTDRVVVWYDQPYQQAAAEVARAGGRLAADGWRVREESDHAISATRDGLVVSLSSMPADESAVTLILLVSKGFSPYVVAATAVGLLVGAAVGWLVAVWAVQRYRRHGPGRRVLIMLAGLPGLVIGGLLLLLTTRFLVALASQSHEFTPKDVQLPAFLLAPAYGVAEFMAISALLALGLAALPGGLRRTPAGIPPHPPVTT